MTNERIKIVAQRRALEIPLPSQNTLTPNAPCGSLQFFDPDEGITDEDLLKLSSASEYTIQNDGRISAHVRETIGKPSN